MEEQLRLEIRKEIQVYFEEERKKDREKGVVEEEENVKRMPLILGIGTFVAALFLSFTTKNSLTYFIIFSPFYIVASIGCYLIVRTKLHPRVKNNLLLLPNLIYLLGITLPIAILEFGLI